MHVSALEVKSIISPRVSVPGACAPPAMSAGDKHGFSTRGIYTVDH